MIVFRRKKKELSKKDINSLTNAALKKGWWSWSIVPILALLLGVIGLLFGEDAEDHTLAVSLIIAAPICLCLFYFLFKCIYRSMIKNSFNQICDGAIYEFDENGLRATESGVNVKTNSEINYEYYKKVIENETSYTFYAQNNGIFIIQKDDLEEGSLEEFNLILITAYKENFRPYLKKK